MTKGLTVLTLSATLALTSATALAQDLYGSVKLGIADYVFTESNGFAAIATLGVPLPQFGDNIAFEAEYATTLSDPKFLETDVSYNTFGGYGVYALPIADQLALRTRLGIAYERVKLGGTTESALAGSASVGLSYQFRDNMRFIADHTLIGTDIAHTGVGVQMNF